MSNPSVTNLGCANFGLTNPVTVVLDGAWRGQVGHVEHHRPLDGK